MRELKYKIGDRVRILRCEDHPGDRHCRHSSWFGHVGEITSVSPSQIYPYEIAGDDGNSWNEEEIEPVAKEGETVSKRTFKLLKDLPNLKKGALFQEEYEDDTQPYSLINNVDVSVSYSDRSVVEDQPDFFVEVFKVNPEYMTKEELEQFEAFKKGKTVAKKPVDRPKKAKKQLTPAQEARYAKLRTPEHRAAQSRKLKAYWKKKRAAEGKA